MLTFHIANVLDSWLLEMSYFYVYLKNETNILYISSVRNAFLDLLYLSVNECNDCQTTKDVLKYFPIMMTFYLLFFLTVLYTVFLDIILLVS